MPLNRRTSRSADILSAVRQEAAQVGLVRAGLSPRAAALLVYAGYTTTEALKVTSWEPTAVAGKYESLDWRLSVGPECSPKILAEIRCFHEELTVASGLHAAQRRQADAERKARSSFDVNEAASAA